MGIAHGGVSDQQWLGVANPVGKVLWSELEKLIPRARLHLRAHITSWYSRARKGGAQLVALGRIIAVNGDVTEVVQQFGGPVSAWPEIEQVGIGVDQPSGCLSGAKRFVENHVFDEGNIRLHTADPEFPEGAIHALQGDLKSRSEGGQLYQHGIVEGRDD